MRSGSAKTNPGTLPRATDLTLTAATETELRRRAAEGDQRAAAELTRRRAESVAWAQAA